MINEDIVKQVKERLLVIAYKRAVADNDKIVLNLLRQNKIQITREALFIGYTRIDLPSFMLQTDCMCSRILIAAFYKSAYPKGHDQL